MLPSVKIGKFMQVSRIQSQYFSNYNQKSLSTNNVTAPNISTPSYVQVPAGFRYNANIHFGEFFDPNRKVPHIDYEEYMAMTPNTKQRFRKMYSTYAAKMDKSQMVDKQQIGMPLSLDKTMDSFIETASIYKKYKHQPIICLGRSPKWFLNAALWMKDGIDDYDFLAFSGSWFVPDYAEGVRKIPKIAPSEKEVATYRKYLDKKELNPKNIVDKYHETGQKTVITDFVATGKGMTSFLDLMSDYAEDQGVLEEFSKSIQIVAIGSMDYMESLSYDDTISTPRVYMPPKLQKYGKNIKQEFYNIKDYKMFEDMLMNQNTNECRSTYYPHQAWTVYRPDRFKTGMIKDVKKAKDIIKECGNPKIMSWFTPAMYDYRNLLNFRILDGLYQRNLLKTDHKSKL